MRLILALALLANLGLMGCASSIPLPGTTKLLDELPRVENTSAAPCWMQIEVAKQNAYLDSIKAGRELVYAAPCQIKPKPPRVASSDPKTS